MQEKAIKEKKIDKLNEVWKEVCHSNYRIKADKEGRYYDVALNGKDAARLAETSSTWLEEVSVSDEVKRMWQCWDWVSHRQMALFW